MVEIMGRFDGWIQKTPVQNDRYIFVLAPVFPWSPAVLTSKFKLKICVSRSSSLSTLAVEYYSRFEHVEVELIESLSDVWDKIASAESIIDEGWLHTQREVKRFLQMSESKTVVRVASGFNVSVRKTVGRSEAKKLEVLHTSVAGVTDLKSSVFVWKPIGMHLPTMDCAVGFPTRDLRSVLKCGIDGKRTSKPSVLPVEPVGKVVELRPGVVSAAGLFPVNQTRRPPKVRTKLGTKIWVTRELVPLELFAVKDLPEPLFLLIRNSKEVCSLTKSLFNSCRVPLKSLDFLLARAIDVGATTPRLVTTDGRATSTTGEPELKESRAEPFLRAEESDCETTEELIALLHRKLEEEKTENRSKKSDDELPTETIWDIRVLPLCNLWRGGGRVDWRRAFTVLRKWILKLWKRSVLRSVLTFRRGLETKVLSKTTKEAIKDCVTRVADATIWNWDGGSRPFFWNWPTEWQGQIKDGFAMWLRSGSIEWKVAQPKPNEKDRLLMCQKIEDVRRKGYVQQGKAKSLIRFFGVPKGDKDIRMVYDGTMSGLNDALWAPGFPLPTAQTLLRMVDRSTWMADNDAGEFFLNWVMDKKIQILCGVDFTHFLPPKQTVSPIEIWTRCPMGLRPSPYFCVKGMLLAQEIMLGDRHDPRNVFRFDSVLLNLPGMKDYNAARPMVSKIRKDGTLAADVVCYVDDVRPVAPTEEECWEASQVVSKTLARLGLQDASRKRNAPSQSPGPWGGVVVTTDNDKVYVSVSQKKWDRTKEIVKTLNEAYAEKRIGYKMLERMVGYLVHVAQAYPSLKPYLNGLYGTLNAWRPDRDKDGWKERDGGKKRQKLDPGEYEFDMDETCDWRTSRFDLEEDDVKQGENNQEDHPSVVQFIARSKRDIESLTVLVEGEEPPLRMVRGNESVSMLYGFGDASGYGFGSAMQLQDGTVYYQAGLWGEEFSLARSSNYRELRNLVEFVESAAEKGLLHGAQFMLFTDNLVADYAFNKGSSSDEKLHELVLRLRKLEMGLSAELLIVHVSGLRMIESGVDGISRGDLSAGLSAGQSIFDFIPLHLAAIERSENLMEWIKEWAGAEAELLSPDRWPEVHCAGGTYVWCPPPAAASAVIDFLGSSTHKRSNSIHVIVVPRMMTSQWKKNLGKLTDIQFGIPCDTPVWPARMFEDLDMFISLPLSKFSNEAGAWRFKGSERVDRCASAVRGMWKSDFGNVGNTLRELLAQSRRVQAL